MQNDFSSDTHGACYRGDRWLQPDMPPAWCGGIGGRAGGPAGVRRHWVCGRGTVGPGLHAARVRVGIRTFRYPVPHDRLNCNQSSSASERDEQGRNFRGQTRTQHDQPISVPDSRLAANPPWPDRTRAGRPGLHHRSGGSAGVDCRWIDRHRCRHRTGALGETGPSGLEMGAYDQGIQSGAAQPCVDTSRRGPARPQAHYQ